MEIENNKKKLGRRAILELTQEILDEVEMLSSQGLTQTHLMGYYGVSKAAWFRKCFKFPILREAYNRGKSKGISNASLQLMKLINKGNLDAIKFYLSRVGKFTEDKEIEEDGNVVKNATINFNVTDPIEAAKIYQQIMQRSAKDE